jgi:hypothetical protein
VLSFAVTFASLSTLKNCWVKTHFAEANQHVLIFLSKFNSHGHILRTGGVALRDQSDRLRKGLRETLKAQQRYSAPQNPIKIDRGRNKKPSTLEGH